jgi:hypothetical protein
MTEHDPILRTVLDRIDRAERNFRIGLLVGAGLETLFLAGLMLLTDFSDRLHVLVFASGVTSYTLTVIGLVVLGAGIQRHVERILQAIATLRKSE